MSKFLNLKGKYLVFTFILVSLSVLVTVVVLNVHFRSSNTHEMPVWTKSLFLYVLPRILLMKRPPIASSIATSNQLRDYAQSFLSETQKSNRRRDANGKKTSDEDQLKYIENLDSRLDTFTLIEQQQHQQPKYNNKRVSRKDGHTQQQQQQRHHSIVQPSIRNRLMTAKKQRIGSNWSLGPSRRGNEPPPLSQVEVEVLEDKLEAIGALNNIVCHLKEEHRQNRVKKKHI